MKIAWDFDSVEKYCTNLDSYVQTLNDDLKRHNTDMTSTLSLSSGSAIETISNYDMAVETSIILINQSISDFSNYLKSISKLISEAEDTICSINL